MRRRSLSTVLAAVVFSAAVAAASLVGRPLMVLVLWPLQVLLAWLWLGYCGAPSRVRGLLIAAAAAAAADLELAVRKHPSVGVISSVIALGLVAAVVGQLARRNRTAVTDVLAAQVSSVLLVSSVSLLVALRVLHSGAHAEATGLVAMAAGVLVAQAADRVVPRPGLLDRGLVGLVLAIAVAALVGALILGRHGAALGAVAGTAGVLADLVVASGGGSRRLVRPLGALLPLAFAAPALYVTGRVLLG